MEKWLRSAGIDRMFEFLGTPFWKQRGVLVLLRIVFTGNRKELEHFRNLGKKWDRKRNAEVGAGKVRLGSGEIAGEESAGGDVLRRPFFGEEEEKGVGSGAILGMMGDPEEMVEAIGEVADVGGVSLAFGS